MCAVMFLDIAPTNDRLHRITSIVDIENITAHIRSCRLAAANAVLSRS